MTRRLLISLPAAWLVPAAQNNWDSPPFPAWDNSLADRILTGSPWAQEVRVPFRQAFAAAGRPGSIATEVHLTVRWGSALPVRQASAFALGLETRAAQKLLRTEPGEYLIEIAGLPASVVRDSKAFEKELAATARLTGLGRAGLKAVSAAVPEFGTHVMAEVRFPRDPALRLEDKEVEFSATALDGAMRLRARFALKPMLYQGSLAL